MKTQDPSLRSQPGASIGGALVSASLVMVCTTIFAHFLSEEMCARNDQRFRASVSEATR